MGAARRWCSPPATSPTSALSPRSPTPARWSSPMPLNHASLVDACRLARGRVVVTPHRDVAAVDERWPAVRASAPSSSPTRSSPSTATWPRWPSCTPSPVGTARCWSSTRRTPSASSATTGAARPRAAGIAGEPDVVLTVTLSQVARVAGRRGARGRRRVVEHLVNTARAFIFDTGLAPPRAGAARGRARGAARTSPGSRRPCGAAPSSSPTRRAPPGCAVTRPGRRSRLGPHRRSGAGGRGGGRVLRGAG